MKAVFLDRDGTLVRMFPQDGLPPRGPRLVSEINFLPGVVVGCRLLRDEGWYLCIITNQPDISRNLTTWQDQIAINNAVSTALQINNAMTCPHQDADKCQCRKPQPALINTVCDRLPVDKSRCLMIGDSDRDEQAAAAAGVRFVKTDGTNFLECVKWILGNCE